jgi:plasmid stabilization system protein ParE
MVKRKIIWSHKAKRDLLVILDFYYQRNGNKAYSNKLNLSLRKAVRLLARHPEIGIQTDLPNIRNLILGEKNVFYKINPGVIEIITIWDSRQDPDKLKFIGA